MMQDAKKRELKIRQGLDKQSIREVLYRYAEGIDGRDWDMLRRCFTSDVAADYGTFGKWYSAEEITRVMTELHKDMGLTLHRMSNILIEFYGDTAHCKSYVHALLNQNSEGTKVIHAYGHYADQFVKQQGIWKISERKFTLVTTL